jgi:hypothetical protein
MSAASLEFNTAIAALVVLSAFLIANAFLCAFILPLSFSNFARAFRTASCAIFRRISAAAFVTSCSLANLATSSE